MTETIQPYDATVNLLQALLWQYNEAPHLLALLESKQDWYNINQSDFWDNFYTNIFNLETANYFGLSVWSIILNQPIVFYNIGDPNKQNFGFEQFHKNFANGNFVSTSGYNYVLPLESARLVLQLRYHQLTSSGTIPETNRFLAQLFKNSGPFYLLDGHDMTQVYVIGFEPDANLRFILNNFDILPRPAGVGSTYRIEVAETFGFDQYHENFDNGNFFEG